MNRGEILDTARLLTYQDRQASYGDPKENWGRTAKLWSAYLGYDITASQAAVMIALVKIARLAATPGHFDSFVDAAAYMAIAGEVYDAKKNIPNPSPSPKNKEAPHG